MTAVCGRRLALAAVACLLPVVGLAEPAPRAANVRRLDGKRTAIARMSILLDQALREVSRPSPLNLFGPAQTTRGYRIPGVGVVFIVPARTLPSDRVARQRRGVPARPAPTERIFDRGSVRTGTPGSRQAAARPVPDEDVRALQEVEEQMRLMSEAARRMHGEADREAEQLFEALRKGAAGAGDGALPDQLLVLPPMPPWFEWWGDLPDDTRTPAQALDEVRDTLGRVLVKAEPFDLAPEESIVVTVDFFDDVALDLSAHPTATLIARIKAGSLDPARQTPLTRAEIEKRVEYTEFE